MISLRTAGPAFLMALASLTSVVRAEWDCNLDGTGITPEQLGTIRLTFDLAFGTDPITLAGVGDGGTTDKVAICQGLTFGIGNKVGYSAAETDTSRDEATSTNTNGSGICNWDVSDAIVYTAAWEEDITWCPAIGCATTEIVTC